MNTNCITPPRVPATQKRYAIRKQCTVRRMKHPPVYTQSGSAEPDRTVIASGGNFCLDGSTYGAEELHNLFSPRIRRSTCPRGECTTSPPAGVTGFHHSPTRSAKETQQICSCTKTFAAGEVCSEIGRHVQHVTSLQGGGGLHTARLLPLLTTSFCRCIDDQRMRLNVRSVITVLTKHKP